jgi:sugar/nucleoside kinase (ribokinase family)
MHAPLKLQLACALHMCTQVSVISLGPKGCIARAQDGSRGASDAAKVKVVDTIGAGDCFTAGFLYAYLQVSHAFVYLPCNASVWTFAHHRFEPLLFTPWI